MLPLQLPKSLKQSLSGQYLDKEVLDSYIVPILTRIFLPNFFSNNLCNSSDACDSSQPAAARFIFWYVPNFLPPTAAHVFFCCVALSTAAGCRESHTAKNLLQTTEGGEES